MSCLSRSASVVQGELSSSFVPFAEGRSGAARLGCEMDLDMLRPLGFLRDAREEMGVRNELEGVDEVVELREGIVFDDAVGRATERGGSDMVKAEVTQVSDSEML